MNWKIFTAFVAGGIVGGFGTWYGVKKHYKSIADEEIEAMREWYEKKLKEKENEKTIVFELSGDLSDEEKDALIEKMNETPSGVVAYPEEIKSADDIPTPKISKGTRREYENLATQYNKMYKDPAEKPSLEDLAASLRDSEEEIEEEHEDGVECVREPPTSQLEGPMIVSEEEYGADWRNEKVTITYYVEDKTLADEDDSIIDDIESTVSQKAIDILVSEDLDAIYVRNNRLGIDYEIIYDAGSYSEIVLEINSYEDEEVGGKKPMKNRRGKLDDEE